MLHLCNVLINFHTHHPTLAPDVLELESVYLGQTTAARSKTCSLGLHPWYLANFDPDAASKWLHTQAASADTMAIGEAGLDKVCKTPWEVQIQAFQLCVQVSEAQEKPLIIHCVRAYPEIIAFKKSWKPRQNWIFHGFDKNLPTAAMILRAGCFLSFGAALFKTNSHAAESLLATPEDRFLLETDNADLNIQTVYEKAAAIRGLALTDLIELMQRNFEKVC